MYFPFDTVPQIKLIMVNVLLFGMIKDMIGSSSISLHAVNDTNELIKELYTLFPQLTQATFVIAVDRDVIQENTILQQNVEVALLPPFSGG
jgi:molybdopterin synthase sulfur carrier subunit